jgi:hypothetical protein
MKRFRLFAAAMLAVGLVSGLVLVSCNLFDAVTGGGNVPIPAELHGTWMDRFSNTYVVTSNFFTYRLDGYYRVYTYTISNIKSVTKETTYEYTGLGTNNVDYYSYGYKITGIVSDYDDIYLFKKGDQFTCTFALNSDKTKMMVYEEKGSGYYSSPLTKQ